MNTTIQLSSEFKSELKALSLDNETYESTIKRLIGGTKERISSINEPYAFEIESFGINGSKGYEITKVTYEELKESEVGSEFGLLNVLGGDAQNTIAKVLFKDNTGVIVRFTTEFCESNNTEKEVEVVHFNLL
ncbi:MAG: hypothetical protein ACRC1M_08570 [Methanobacteriaceae archaeon]